MRKTLIRLALASAAVTVLAAGAASAQMPPPPAPPPGPPAPPMPPMEMMMGMDPGMGMGDAMFMHHGRADPEKRAQRLRDVLQLRPDQDGALKTFVDATSPKIVIRREEVSKTEKGDKKDGDKQEWAEPKPPTTLERLDHMTKAADAIKQRAEATRAFYLALTPSQQKTFDVLGMGEGEGGERIFVRHFDTHGPAVFKDGERKIVIQRKVG
jgi:Spy/CpxP family protein refolding chaperone